jgi:predicted nucleotidyltransferase
VSHGPGIEAVIEGMAAGLSRVPGVAAVTLGGSRARGEQRADSDWDIGVYYREPLDVDGLRTLAAGLAGRPVDVAPPGGWGPWVNGGAWLTVGGTQVDWILRDLDRVRRVWADCQAGRYEIGYQNGHPLGFWSPCYAGEVALGRVLADPAGELSALRAETASYPEPLRAALIGASSQAAFTLDVARKPAVRGDVLYVSLSVSRAVGVLVQSLFAHARRWCLNEKGALDAAGRLPGAPPGFTARARVLLGSPGTTPQALTATVAAAAALVTDTRAALTS